MLIRLSENARLYHADCRAAIRELPDNSIDAVVTDPPYALVSIVKRFGGPNAAPAKGNDAYMRASRGFMQKTWDTGEVAFSEEFWTEVLRVLKPGGHVAAFGASRGYHRMACAIEDAGFEIRDSLLDIVQQDDAVAAFLDSLNDVQREAFARTFEQSQFGGLLAWCYATGFPKSHSVGAAIDKMLGAEREVIGFNAAKAERFEKALKGQNDGWDRPWMHEPDAAQRKGNITAPATDAARQWEGWGTALKPAFEPIVLARKPLSEKTVAANVLRWGTGALNIDGCRVNPGVPVSGGGNNFDAWRSGEGRDDRPGTHGNSGEGHALGRWPANVVHDGSDEVVGAFPYSKSGGGDKHPKTKSTFMVSTNREAYRGTSNGGDEGSAARFFYSAKASRADRNGSKHPTIKPIALMQWLARLITPPGGTVLDPFAGSGTTGAACEREGFACVLVEREAEYVADIRARFGPVEHPWSRVVRWNRAVLSYRSRQVAAA